MKKLIFIGFLSIFLLCGVFFLWRDKLSSSISGNLNRECLNIVATTGIIADTVKQITGNLAEVQALMGPGVDPHLYHARESDVQRLASADIIFYNGLHLEGKMGQILEQMAMRVPTYAVAAVLKREELRSSPFFAGEYDPHIWFDVKLWMHVVVGIRNVLMRHDSEHAEQYSVNAEKFLAELSELDAYIHQRIAEIPERSRVLITAHDAFSYFGRAYGMKIVSLQGISTDSEVGINDVTRVVDYIVQHNVPAIFTEASLPRRMIDAVVQAAEMHGQKVILGPELYSDTLGQPGTIQATYVGMVFSVVDRIVDALSHQQGKKL